MQKRRLYWTPQWNLDDIVVWIEVAKLDAPWREETGYYIPPWGIGSEYKYRGFGKWLVASNVPIWMPHVGFSETGAPIGFTDGRHRFAWLRDHGVAALPVTTDAESADELRDRVGTRKRVSWLPQTRTPLIPV